MLLFDNVTGTQLMSGVLVIASVFGVIYSIAKFTVNCNKQQSLLAKLEEKVAELTESIDSIYNRFNEVETIKRNLKKNTDITINLYSSILAIVDDGLCEDGSSKDRLLEIRHNLNDMIVEIYKENQ